MVVRRVQVRTLNNIQLLRGIAALLVVLTHLGDVSPQFIGGAFDFGGRGVDLFFVISGFVMVYTTGEDRVTPRQFLLNRAIRIVPLYWAMTLAVFAIALVLPTLLRATRPDFVELAKSLLFIPFRKSNGYIHPVLATGWTLNYEMFFYLLFGMGLAIRNVAGRVLAVSTPLCLAVLLGALLPFSSVAGSFYTNPIMVEFVFGMLIGLAYPRLESHPPPVYACILLAILGWVVLVLAIAAPPGFPPIVAALGSSAIIISALALEIRGIRYSGRWMLLLGASSYALYLSHPFVLVPFEDLIVQLPANGGWWPLPLMLVATALTVPAAFALHLAIERPATSWLRGRLSRSEKGPQGENSALWPWRQKPAAGGDKGDDRL